MHTLTITRTLISTLLLSSGCYLKSSEAPEQPVPVAPAATVLRPEVSANREIDGDRVHVRIRCPEGLDGQCEEAAEVALREVQRMLELASIWSTSGDVARLNQAAGQGPVEISPDLHRMLTSAQLVAAGSGGAFDVTIGALSGLWEIEGAELPSDEVLSERLALVDWTRLHLGSGTAELETDGMSVIIGGLIGGDAADSALSLIPMEWDALVNVDGDLAVRGEWQVDIPVQNQSGGETITMWVRDTVLVASGVHGTGTLDGAIDPRTGKASPGGSWAVATHKQGAIADALATTLLVTGPDTSVVDQLGAWALLMTDEGWVEIGGRSASVQSWSVQEVSP